MFFRDPVNQKMICISEFRGKDTAFYNLEEVSMNKNIPYFFVCFLLLIGFSAENVMAAGAPVDMVFVPSGYSMMGAEYGDLYAENNTKPYHLIYIDGFYMDVHEVTNFDYSVCVAAGKCKKPEIVSSKTREDYYTNPVYAQFPVVNVTWQDAADYCSFVEKRLPTEAEWERAARGKEDNRRYPWGNGSPKNYNMNITQVPGDTERVNIYTQGFSPYGIADMMSNVSEWTSDWYDETWYENREQNDPKGPETGFEKVVRGGNFDSKISELHIASRFGLSPDTAGNTVGFRCALGIRESVTYNTSNEKEEYEPEFAYIKAGNENGIFLLSEPGSGYDAAMMGVVPNGAVVEIIAGPVSINYSEWYQMRTQNGESGWTLASAVVPVENPK